MAVNGTDVNGTTDWYVRTCVEGVRIDARIPWADGRRIRETSRS